MATVTINGHTYSDDSSPTTGLAGGGHRTRFIPLIQDVVAVTAGVSGSSTVYGPASATDNALMRFDGTTGKYAQNSIATLDDNGVIIISTTVASMPIVDLINQANDNTGPYLLTRSNRNSAATQTNDYLGSWQSYGWDGTDWRMAARIEFQASGAPTANGTPGRMAFSTSDGTTLTEQVVIDQNGKVSITDYTVLGIGAPAIKMKKLTGTSPAAEGGTVSITHGLTASKILSVTATIQDSNWNDYRLPGDRYAADCEYNLSISATGITVALSATNSGYLLSRPVKIIVTYEQ